MVAATHSESSQAKHGTTHNNTPRKRTIMEATQKQWFSDSPFAEEFTQVIFDNECSKASEDFVSYTVGETDESPDELTFKFEVEDEGRSSLTLTLTEGTVVINHLILDKGNSEVTPLIWSLNEDIDIFLEDLTDKHGIDLVEAKSHGTEIK
jgi:hypothetical protein